MEGHPVVCEDDSEEDQVGQEADHLRSELKEEEVGAFLWPVALNVHVDHM